MPPLENQHSIAIFVQSNIIINFEELNMNRFDVIPPFPRPRRLLRVYLSKQTTSLK